MSTTVFQKNLGRSLFGRGAEVSVVVTLVVVLLEVVLLEVVLLDVVLLDVELLVTVILLVLLVVEVPWRGMKCWA